MSGAATRDRPRPARAGAGRDRPAGADRRAPHDRRAALTCKRHDAAVAAEPSRGRPPSSSVPTGNDSSTSAARPDDPPAACVSTTTSSDAHAAVAQLLDEPGARRAAVDQHGPPVGRLQQRRVALADVQERDREPRRRARRAPPATTAPAASATASAAAMPARPRRVRASRTISPTAPRRRPRRPTRAPSGVPIRTSIAEPGSPAPHRATAATCARQYALTALSSSAGARRDLARCGAQHAEPHHRRDRGEGGEICRQRRQ